jgi:hypothetical protein
MSTHASNKSVQSHCGDRGYEMYLVTAAGRINCLRCTAQSTRTKSQCKKPALRISRTQKCGFHGGRPHSDETLRRIAEANTTHGESSKAAKEKYRDDSAMIHELEDALYVLKMAEGPRTRGRKPASYRGVHTQDDVFRMISERLAHSVSPLKR